MSQYFQVESDMSTLGQGHAILYTNYWGGIIMIHRLPIHQHNNMPLHNLLLHVSLWIEKNTFLLDYKKNEQ